MPKIIVSLAQRTRLRCVCAACAPRGAPFFYYKYDRIPQL